MNPSVWQRLDGWARAAAPASVTLMLALIGSAPLHIPFLSAVLPPFALAAVYYWAVQRPDLMPFGVVFGIGLMQDILAGSPLGLHAFVFLIVQWFVVQQRRHIAGKPFFVLWWGFLGVAVLAAGLLWSAASLVHGSILPLQPVATSTLLLAVLFPLQAWLLIQVQRSFLN